MFRILIMFSFGLIIAGPASSYEAGDLFRSCKIFTDSNFSNPSVTPNGLEKVKCHAYMMAWMKSGSHACVATQQEDLVLPHGGQGVAFEAPSVNALAQAFVNFAEKNPQYWERSAVFLGNKFLDVFPCK